MKIVHYLSSMTRSAGGLYYSVSGLSKAQARLGHSVTVIGGADGFADEDRGMWDGVTLLTHPVKTAGYGLSRRVPKMVSSQRPDILHVHGIWSAASIYGYLASRQGIATVVSPRGMLDPWILKRSERIKKLHAALFEKPLLKRGLAHALNDSERDSIAKFTAPDASRIIVVPNGVNLTAETSTVLRSGALYLGRLHEKKQVLELIAAWASAPELHDVPLKIAGWGAPEYEALVTTACNGSANIEFVGSAYGSEKERLLRSAQFFILPSLSEGLPMAVLEAMSVGAIPVITAECNLPELFAQQSAIEMKTDFSDFSAVAARMTRMTPDDIAGIRSRVSTSIKAFAWSSIAATMLERYQDFLTSRGQRAR